MKSVRRRGLGPFPVAKSALASIDGFWVSAVLAALVANSLHVRRRVAAPAGTAS
ncbi:MAG: hypothetical protein WCA12_08440 [Burkholderiales bacterium]